MPRQAYSLDMLMAEVNAHAPNRHKGSDGGIGDPRHAALVSDHNPNDAGVWRARDITDDPAGGLDGSELAHLLAGRLGKIPALGAGAYIIHNARIISTDRLGEGWRPYAGENAHTRHVHVSVATNVAGYDSRRRWELWTVPAIPRPRPAPEPVAMTRLRNEWTNYREVSWSSFNQLIERGEQPDALAAKVARDKIAAAMRTFFDQVES